jgi:hypothetical protein
MLIPKFDTEVPIQRVKLEYLKGSKQKMAWALEHGIDGRMWNVIAPLGHVLRPFHHSTRTVEGLKELGVIRA